MAEAQQPAHCAGVARLTPAAPPLGVHDSGARGAGRQRAESTRAPASVPMRCSMRPSHKYRSDAGSLHQGRRREAANDAARTDAPPKRPRLLAIDAGADKSASLAEGAADESASLARNATAAASAPVPDASTAEVDANAARDAVERLRKSVALRKTKALVAQSCSALFDACGVSAAAAAAAAEAGGAAALNDARQLRGFDTDMSRRSCEALGRMAAVSRMHASAVVERGGLTMAAAAISDHRHNEHVAVAAIHALHAMTPVLPASDCSNVAASAITMAMRQAMINFATNDGAAGPSALTLDVLRAGCRALHAIMVTLPATPCARSTEQAAETCVLMLDVMRLLPDDVDIAYSACSMLYALAFDAAANITVIATTNGISIVLRAMSTHHDPVVALACYGVLVAVLQNVPEAVDDFTAAGGAEALVTVMTWHLGDAGMTRMGVVALEIVGESPAAAAAILGAGGVGVVVQAAKQHSTRVDVLTSCCSALDSFIELLGDAVLLEADGVDTIVQIMMNHGGAAEPVALAACNLLLALNPAGTATNERQVDATAALWRVGGVAAAAAMFRARPRCLPTLQSVMALQLRAASSIAALPAADAACVISTLTTAMFTNGSVAAFALFGCRVMATLPAQTTWWTAAAAPMAEAVLRAMDQHFDDPELLCIGLIAIDQLAVALGDPTLHDVADRTVATIVTTIRAHAINCVVLHFGCGALRSLSLVVPAAVIAARAVALVTETAAEHGGVLLRDAQVVVDALASSRGHTAAHATAALCWPACGAYHGDTAILRTNSADTPPGTRVRTADEATQRLLVMLERGPFMNSAAAAVWAMPPKTSTPVPPSPSEPSSDASHADSTRSIQRTATADASHDGDDDVDIDDDGNRGADRDDDGAVAARATSHGHDVRVDADDGDNGGGRGDGAGGSGSSLQPRRGDGALVAQARTRGREPKDYAARDIVALWVRDADAGTATPADTAKTLGDIAVTVVLVPANAACRRSGHGERHLHILAAAPGINQSNDTRRGRSLRRLLTLPSRVYHGRMSTWRSDGPPVRVSQQRADTSGWLAVVSNDGAHATLVVDGLGVGDGNVASAPAAAAAREAVTMALAVRPHAYARRALRLTPTALHSLSMMRMAAAYLHTSLGTKHAAFLLKCAAVARRHGRPRALSIVTYTPPMTPSRAQLDIVARACRAVGISWHDDASFAEADARVHADRFVYPLVTPRTEDTPCTLRQIPCVPWASVAAAPLDQLHDALVVLLGGALPAVVRDSADASTVAFLLMGCAEHASERRAAVFDPLLHAAEPTTAQTVSAADVYAAFLGVTYGTDDVRSEVDSARHSQKAVGDALTAVFGKDARVTRQADGTHYSRCCVNVLPRNPPWLSVRHVMDALAVARSPQHWHA